MPETVHPAERKTGRPPTPIADKRVIFARFIDAVEDGDSVRQALARANTSWGAIARWLGDDANTTEDGEPFGVRYARARITSASAYADRALDAAFTATSENVQVARLQVDTLKWRAAMANPKEYGDRKQVEVSGNVAHLHLDALRNRNTVNNLSVPSVSVKLLDTVQDLDTEQTPNLLGEPE